MKKSFSVAGLLLLSSVAVAQTAPAPEPVEKVRCKRIVETGSNAKAKKICRTAKQWQQTREEAKRDAGQMMEPTGHTSSGG